LVRDLGIEGTRGDREIARKIFEMGAKSGHRNARLHSEGRVQEEEAESEWERERQSLRTKCMEDK
jgi:hypothetical protein